MRAAVSVWTLWRRERPLAFSGNQQRFLSCQTVRSLVITLIELTQLPNLCVCGLNCLVRGAFLVITP